MLVACVAMSLTGCGESGSNPPVLPEVLFQIGPAPGGTGAPVTFSVPTLFTAGALNTFPAGMTFTTTGVFSIYLEGATQPYGGIFVRSAGSGDITVQESIFTAPGTPQIVTRDTTAGKDPPVATVVIPAMVTPSTTPVAANPEVRFDICVPTSGASSCFPPGESGIPGVQFTGSLGDAFFTHQVGVNPVATTPSVYFLMGARDSVNGVFQSTNGQSLLVQLYVNGQLKQSSSGSGDVVVREDL